MTPLAASQPSVPAELSTRYAAMRSGFWLGWLSILAVLAGLALGAEPRHRTAVLVLVALAGAGNAAVMLAPWERWLTVARGQLVLDAWSLGLIGLISTLVAVAGGRAGYDLLLFLALPFIATVQVGWRRVAWLGLAAASFPVTMTLAPDPLPAAVAAMHAVLLAAAVVLALALAALTRREATARAEASTRAALEHALLGEAHHRVSNSLQTVAELLVLARPSDPDAARALDETAARVGGIAAVHRLLAREAGGTVSGAAVVSAVVANAGQATRVHVEDVELDVGDAQQLAIVTNELLTNALRHGAPPVEVRLRRGPPISLEVEDHGPGLDDEPPGLGFQLVHQIVEHGLHGHMAVADAPAGGTRASVWFDPGGLCES